MCSKSGCHRRQIAREIQTQWETRSKNIFGCVLCCGVFIDFRQTAQVFLLGLSVSLSLSRSLGLSLGLSPSPPPLWRARPPRHTHTQKDTVTLHLDYYISVFPSFVLFRLAFGRVCVSVVIGAGGREGGRGGGIGLLHSHRGLLHDQRGLLDNHRSTPLHLFPSSTSEKVPVRVACLQ